MIHRTITPLIKAALADTPVVFLAGARQTGKSTLVRNLAGDKAAALYITLDDYSVLSAAKTDPKGFISGLPEKVIIDEVQRAPELFLEIKASVNNDRKPGRFLLTGSANVLLLPKIADSLAGRIEILTLWPFSQGELRGKNESFIDTLFSGKELPQPPVMSEMELWKAMTTGGYPEVIDRPAPERKEAWFRSYITTILQRDIRELAHIDGLTALPNLLHLAAARTGRLLNFADFSRSIQLPQSSLKRYFALLESIYLVHRVQPWSGNLTSRLTKSPKIHLSDSGLASFLLGTDAKRLAEDHTLAGQLLETFVVNELLKQSGWSAFHPRLYHFRTSSGREVDIILEDNHGRCVAIEVKTSAGVSAADADGLRFFQDAVKQRFLCGIILYRGKEIVPFQKAIRAVPISALWS